MRIIKFRAWDAKRRNMFQVLATYFEKNVKRKRDWFIGFNGSGLEVSEYEGKGNWRVFPIMQFTGLTDQNGVDIYEDDVISFWWSRRRTGKVSFKNGCFMVDDIFRLCECPDDTEVIGNIHEHPELLPTASTEAQP